MLEDASAGGFLRALEITPMVRSYKMLLVLAALDAGVLAGPAAIEAVAAGVRRLAARSRALSRDLGDALDDPARLRALLERNPIAAFVGGRGTGRQAYLRYEAGHLSAAFRLPERLHGAFAELAPGALRLAPGRVPDRARAVRRRGTCAT